MDGRSACSWSLILIPMLIMGCGEARPQTSTPAQAQDMQTGDLHHEAGIHFKQEETGAIEGVVLWEGPVPAVPPFRVHTNRYPGKESLQGIVRDVPNVPRIDATSRGVAEAVVFLLGVDVRRARVWDHPPVRIEQSAQRLQVFQGDAAVNAGFVRRGHEITMTARDTLFYSLHADGADYFTYTLYGKDRPARRRLERAGLTELSSGAGCYWMRGYLLVDDHPYYARTDKTGRFRLDQVPTGTFELVCWLPNWHIARQERDPESCLVTRIFLSRPLEQVKTVSVGRGQEVQARFSAASAAFENVSAKR